MICPFEIDIDRLAHVSAGVGSGRSPVRGRWDTVETQVQAVPAAWVSPATFNKLQQTAVEMVWRNLDLQFSDEELTGIAKPS